MAWTVGLGPLGPNDRDLIVILQVEPVYVTFTALQQYLLDIQARWPREALPERPEKRFEGRSVDPATDTVCLKARFENASREHIRWVS